MKGKIVILPGTPDDNNRDYLPEIIKTTDIVVNENGNNSQVMPKRLVEFTGVIADEREDVWYEYIPETYDPSKKTPLVFAMHGGMMTGWGQAIYTSWTMLADRDGFIVVFPTASFNRFWLVEWDKAKLKKGLESGLHPTPDRPEDNHDNKLVLGLLDIMKSKYNIDEGRVFMQGMSMGDMMTNQFTRHFGNILAGAAGSGASVGPGLLFDENGEVINRGGHVAIFQSRPEKNGFEGDLINNKLNREYWLKINGCKSLPEIRIKGEDNFAFYKGEKADLVYLDIKNRDHGQTLDDAANVWDYLFSGTRREPDGRIVHTESVAPRVGDKFAISVSKDCAKAWVNNGIAEMSGPAILWQKLKYHGLNGGQNVRGEYLCAPLSFLAKVFGAQYLPSEDTLSTTLLLKDGRELQFARGSIGCVIDNRIESMLCEALHRGGELYVSVEWFCKSLFNLHVSTYGEVLYATDHYAVLSENLADLIGDLLK